MAKELPYFKFEPSQWDTGNIQMCSQESKGVFIDLCSIYWQRLGELPYKLALQKVCGGNATALTSLCNEGVIKVIEDMICIDFLNEQLVEFENTSSVNSKNAREGWEKRRKNATALQTQSERNAIREDKRREDEMKGEKIKQDKKIVSRDSIAPKKTIEERENDFMNSIAPYVSEYGKEMCRKFYEHWTEKNQGGTKMKFEMQKTWEVGKRLKTWFDNSKNFKNGNNQKGQPQIDGIMELADKVLRGEISGDVFGGY